MGLSVSFLLRNWFVIIRLVCLDASNVIRFGHARVFSSRAKSVFLSVSAHVLRFSRRPRLRNRLCPYVVGFRLGLVMLG